MEQHHCFGWLNALERLSETVSFDKIKIGEHTYYAGYYHEEVFEKACVRYADPHEDSGNLIIGKYCQIASGVIFNIGGNTRHRHDWISSYPFYDFYPELDLKDSFVSFGDTIIGNDVWIGMQAIIMSGVRIGDGAVIGAGSIITKDVEPYSVVVGVPGKTVKKRFSDDEICALLEVKWWDVDFAELRPYIHLMTGNNVFDFVSQIHALKDSKSHAYV